MPEKQRENLATLLVSRKATGKSTYLAKLARGYAAKNPNKRVLILDVNGAPAYAEIPQLTETEFRNWRKDSTIRVAKFYLGAKRENEMMDLVIQHFKNGLLILEDCTKYIKSSPSDEVRAFLVDHRMLNLDLVFTFHSLYKVPPFFWDMVNLVVLGKTDETLENRDRRRYPNFAKLLETFKKVQASKDQYIKLSYSTNT